MKLPARVRVTYKVTYDVVSQEMEGLHGLCDEERKLIHINPTKSKVSQAKTFIHELIHAIDFETEGPPLTERQVRKLEEGIYRVLRLNKLI